MRIKLGSVVTEYVDAVGKNIRGRVVYIHPQKRFYTARFPRGYCESYLPNTPPHKERRKRDD